MGGESNFRKTQERSVQFTLINYYKIENVKKQDTKISNDESNLNQYHFDWSSYQVLQLTRHDSTEQ